MTSRDVDRKLIEILSAYYPDVGTAIARARRAGIAVEEIDTSGATETVWGRIVQWARSRRRICALIDEARADTDSDELRALKVQEMGEADKTRAIDALGDVLTSYIDALRGEMHAMEGRLSGRIDGVEGSIGDLDKKIDTLKAVSQVFTPKKRAAWLIAFVLFCLPMGLLIFEVREYIGVSPMAAGALMAIVWAVACGFFMYALGFVRDL